MIEVTPLIRVLFVCRGSVADGLGHVMRARTVAMEVARRMPVKLIVIGDHYVESLLKGRGLDYQVHPDTTAVAPVLESYKPHVVVFDLMDYPAADFQDVARAAMTVSLSPIFNSLGKVDIIFHRTEAVGNDWSFGDPSPRLRCGLQYAVVREDCVQIAEESYRENLRRNPLSIAISMGGADASNKTLEILNSINKVPNPVLLWVLLGEGYAHSYQSLVDCIKKDSRHEIILAKTNNSMWRIMSTCSLAILAGGTITYEAAFAGLPSINVFDSADHVFLIQELLHRNVCLSAGYPLKDALSVINANLAHLEQNRDVLLVLHQKSSGLIDGNGAQRIAREIEEFFWRDFHGDARNRSRVEVLTS